ncbi:hypothetical protein [Streptomyces formicae]
MSAVLRILCRFAAVLAATVHHLITARVVLLGFTAFAVVALLAHQLTAFGLSLAAAALLTAEGLRAEAAGRAFDACLLCSLSRQGARKEITK